MEKNNNFVINDKPEIVSKLNNKEKPKRSSNRNRKNKNKNKENKTNVLNDNFKILDTDVFINNENNNNDLLISKSSIINGEECEPP